MHRRKFLGRSLAGMAAPAAALAVPPSGGTERPAEAGTTNGVAVSEAGQSRACRPLAGEYTVLWKASDPAREIGYCPTVARLAGGRLLGCMLHAGTDSANQRRGTVKIHTSDDRGQSWAHRADVPMIDCFAFAAGRTAYVIGGRYDLSIVRSDDDGASWSAPVKLTEGKLWYSHPGSAVYANDRIYFVMEQITAPIDQGFPTHVFAPVVLSARLDDDLTRPQAWTFSNVFSFQDVLAKHGPPHLLGVPFYAPGHYKHPTNARHMSPIGWGESNLVQITDPAHLWHDPAGHTFHLLARAVTGRTELACLAKAVESDDRRTITVSLEQAPSGEPILYVPLPGGQVSFHIAYDAPTRLFWMISSQATDSMRRVELLEPKRYNMPEQERHRLVLHFSKNCIDWCFAGVVAQASDVGRSHHGGNMVIDGDDLVILMRTADASAVNAHNSNLITRHTVARFRELVY